MVHVKVKFHSDAVGDRSEHGVYYGWSVHGRRSSLDTCLERFQVL